MVCCCQWWNDASEEDGINDGFDDEETLGLT